MSTRFNLPPLPTHLASDHAQGVFERQPIAQFEIGSHRNFIYLILDWVTRSAAIIDPQKDLAEPLRNLKGFGFELKGVLLTHTHGDHTAGVPDLTELYPGIPIHVHRDDKHRLPKVVRTQGTLHLVEDEEMIYVGEIPVKALHTPGHSAGECCYWVQTGQGYLLTGDTLFIRDCGRTDFDDGSNEQMFQTLQRIRKLPPELVILPGHHYAKETASTLARELLENPPLRCASVEELAALP